MQTWYQPEHPDREAARRTASGAIVMRFGKRENRSMHLLPKSYLKWLSRAAAYLPQELRSRAATIVRRRLECADGDNESDRAGLSRVVDLWAPRRVIAWSRVAAAGDVAEVREYLVWLADQMAVTMDDRAATLEDQLFNEPDRGETVS